MVVLTMGSATLIFLTGSRSLAFSRIATPGATTCLPVSFRIPRSRQTRRISSRADSIVRPATETGPTNGRLMVPSAGHWKWKAKDPMMIASLDHVHREWRLTRWDERNDTFQVDCKRIAGADLISIAFDRTGRGLSSNPSDDGFTAFHCELLIIDRQAIAR